MKLIDLTGNRFGRWTVKGRSESRKGHTRWACRCDCGTVKAVAGISLLNGISKSCGCLRSEIHAASLLKHGHSSGGKVSPTYSSWSSMLQRIGRPDYRGRGISICERWLVFENFLTDMGEKPKPGMSIERIDNDGNYEPGNCK